MRPQPWMRARLNRWWQSRLRPSDAVQLTHRNVYILPTAPGLLLSATLLVLLLASINFQLNLGYALTFLLSGCALVGMHVGHATLRGLQLQLQVPPPRFLDGTAALTVQLHNADTAPRYGVGMAVLGTAAWSWGEVPARASCALQLAWRAPHRGWVALPRLTAETRFPMGAFRVWTVWQPASKVLVYPRPESPEPALPAHGPSQGTLGNASDKTLTEGPWDGVRAYRRGDPLKHVNWKKSASALATGSGALLSHETLVRQCAELHLDYAQTGLADKEARLSRLCAWVCTADRQGAPYSLGLPGQLIGPSSGAAHLHQCLEALALC